MNNQDWFQASKSAPTRFQLNSIFRYLWAAICSGTGAGLIMGVTIVVFDAIGRLFGKTLTSPALDFKLELSAVALVIFTGGAFGLIFASPLAFFFGEPIIRASDKLKVTQQNFVRYGSGISAAIALFYLIGLLNNAHPPLFLEPLQYLIAIIAGASAVFIFLSQIRLPQSKDKQP